MLWANFFVAALGLVVAWVLSYVIQIAITKKTGATRNHRPQALPSSLFRPCDTASPFDIFFSCVIKLGLNFYCRSHGGGSCLVAWFLGTSPRVAGESKVPYCSDKTGLVGGQPDI